MDPRDALKLSVLMPTYNDAEHVGLSIDSVLAQSHGNWELLIVDDGSTDGTEAVIRRYADPRISYAYQDNADQLNALERAARSMTGDVVLFLHSDDMIASPDSFARLAEAFRSRPGVDGFFADLLLMDGEGRGTGTLRAMPFRPRLLLKTVIFRHAGNPLFDVFAVRREAFDRQVRPHYLLDNTIYYIDYERGTLLRLERTRPWYRYRVFNGNYIHSDVGKYVTLSGQMRTIHKLILCGYRMFPNVPRRRLPYRLCNRLGFYRAFHMTKRKAPAFRFALAYYHAWETRLAGESTGGLPLLQIRRIGESLRCRMRRAREKPLTLRYQGEFQYQGKDARRFFRDHASGTLNGFYGAILSDSYDHIVAADAQSAAAAETALRFFSFFYEVVPAGPAGGVQ